MWKSLRMNVKLSILAGESLVDASLLSESDELFNLLLNGGSKEECLTWINENF